MIRSYGDRETESVAQRRRVRRLPEEIRRRAQRKLVILNNAADLNDLSVPPGNRLEKLSGNREGPYNISINDQWRICFVRDEGDAYEVEIVDYH